MANNHRSVAIAGATGLIGSSLLAGLLQDTSVSQIHALNRRSLHLSDNKLMVHILDFNVLPSLPPLDEVYIALGTTIKNAGSKAAFRAVDFDACLAVASAAIAAGASRIGLVSAMGANSQAWSFYTRIKGELENAISSLNAYATVIARPSLLLGDRKRLGQSSRFGEEAAKMAFRLLRPIIPIDYLPIEAAQVAHALLRRVPIAVGCEILSSRELQNY